MNSYANHALLLRAAPGEAAYTEALRGLFSEIRRNPEHPDALREWTALRDAHLQAVPRTEHDAHQILLAPRIMLGGIEASTYVLAFLGLLLCAAGLILFSRLPPTSTAMISTVVGLGLLNALAFLEERRRGLAAMSLNIALPKDTSRHGLYGVSL